MQISLEGILANSVLDIGTGSGIFAEAFFKQIPAVTGVDVSEEMLERASQMVDGADFQQASMETLPFPDSSFDLVFFGHALHESQDLV